MKAGWELKALANLCRVFTDGDWIETKDQSAEGIRLVQTGNVGLGVFKDRRDKARFISEDTFRDLKCFEVLPGDCLISRLPDPVGRACEIPETNDRMITAVDCSIVRTDPQKMDRNYFIYFSQSRAYLNEVDSLCSGTTRRRISRKNLGKISIPLPPIAEQKRIVSILDEAFEGLDRARENAEANLKSARELFEGQRKHMLSGDAEDWKMLTIDQICIVERGSSPRPIKKYVTTSSDGVNWIKIGDTKVGSKYVKSTKEKITPLGAEKSRKVAAGDFILTNSMTYGRPYIMATDGYIHDGWFALRLKDGVDSNYLFHALSSEVVQEQFRNLAAGAVVKNISGDLVKKTIIPIPPLEVQMTLAKSMDNASDEKGKLEASYTAKLQDISDLRQSLLQKAFAGELT